MTAKQYFIQISAPEQVHQDKPLPLRGKFHIPYKNSGLTVKGPEVLKHIILVTTFGGAYWALPPFKDVITFADDIQQIKGGCSGNFNMDVFEKISFTEKGDYYILCSLGIYTSNIVKAVVT
jgi:hypothetical protein